MGDYFYLMMLLCGSIAIIKIGVLLHYLERKPLADSEETVQPHRWLRWPLRVKTSIIGGVSLTAIGAGIVGLLR